MLFSIWIEVKIGELMLKCGKCGNATMKIRNGFASCGVCGKQIFNKEEKDVKKTKKDKSLHKTQEA